MKSDQFKRKTGALPFVPLFWLSAVISLAFLAAWVVIQFDYPRYETEELQWISAHSDTIFNIKDTAARYLAAAFGLAQTVALIGACLAHIYLLFFSYEPASTWATWRRTMCSRAPLLLVFILLLVAACVFVRISDTNQNLKTVRPALTGKLLDVVRDEFLQDSYRHQFVTFCENILAIWVIIGCPLAAGATLCALDDTRAPVLGNPPAGAFRAVIGWILAPFGALMDWDRTDGFVPPWAVGVNKIARMGRICELRTRIKRLRLLLWWASFALVAGLYQLYFEFRWPASLLKGESREAADANSSSFALSAGVFLSLCLLSIFLPAVQILRKRVESVTEAELPTDSPGHKEKWQREEHISLSPRQLYLEIIAVCGPLLAGLVATVLKV
jgi:hypothetical protein